MQRYGPLILSCLLASAVAAEPDAAGQQQLRYLVRQDCGSCHGMTLRGGLGPPLTPDALAGKPVDLLVDSIIDGRPGTAMPPWQGLLSREQALWIVDQLLKGMPQ